MGSMKRREFYTKIVGVTKKNDEGKRIQKILKEMSEEYCEGSLLELEHEADNPYDDNAIKVFYDGEHIGYIGRDLAKELAELVDANMVEAEISEITGGEDGKSFGCNIHIRISDTNSQPDFVSEGFTKTLQGTSKRTATSYKPSSEPNEFTRKTQETSKAHTVSCQNSSTQKRVKYGVAGGLLVLVITLLGILYITEGVNEVFDGLDDQINESSDGSDGDYTVVTADSPEDFSLDERNALKAHVLEVATGCGLPETSEIVLASNRIEISVPTDYSAESMPDNWSTILEEAESTGTSIQDEIPDYTIALMYNDVADNILMTIMSGECIYNAFKIEEEPVEEDDDNPPTITLTEYNQIENGMSYFQVCEIIGGYGEQLSETDLGLGYEYATEMYSWDGEGSIGANANVMFQGGEVISKAQFGLE